MKMKLIKNNKVTTINTLKDVEKLKQDRLLTEKIHKAHDNVELLLQHLTNASDLLKELGISAIMINDNHNVFGTIIEEKYYEGLVIKVDDRIFQILNN